MHIFFVPPSLVLLALNLDRKFSVDSFEMEDYIVSNLKDPESNDFLEKEIIPALVKHLGSIDHLLRILTDLKTDFTMDHLNDLLRRVYEASIRMMWLKLNHSYRIVSKLVTFQSVNLYNDELPYILHKWFQFTMGVTPYYMDLHCQSMTYEVLEKLPFFHFILHNYGEEPWAKNLQGFEEILEHLPVWDLAYLNFNKSTIINLRLQLI